MKWNRVRKLHPNQFVLLKEYKSHIEGDKKYIDDVEVISVFENQKEAITAMIKSSEKIFVYHTSSKELGFQILFSKKNISIAN